MCANAITYLLLHVICIAVGTLQALCMKKSNYWYFYYTFSQKWTQSEVSRGLSPRTLAVYFEIRKQEHYLYETAFPGKWEENKILIGSPHVLFSCTSEFSQQVLNNNWHKKSHRFQETNKTHITSERKKSVTGNLFRNRKLCR